MLLQIIPGSSLHAAESLTQTGHALNGVDRSNKAVAAHHRNWCTAAPLSNSSFLDWIERPLHALASASALATATQAPATTHPIGDPVPQTVQADSVLMSINGLTLVLEYWRGESGLRQWLLDFYPEPPEEAPLIANPCQSELAPLCSVLWNDGLIRQEGLAGLQPMPDEGGALLKGSVWHRLGRQAQTLWGQLSGRGDSFCSAASNKAEANDGRPILRYLERFGGYWRNLFSLLQLDSRWLAWRRAHDLALTISGLPAAVWAAGDSPQTGTVQIIVSTTGDWQRKATGSARFFSDAKGISLSGGWALTDRDGRLREDRNRLAPMLRLHYQVAGLPAMGASGAPLPAAVATGTRTLHMYYPANAESETGRTKDYPLLADLNLDILPPEHRKLVPLVAGVGVTLRSFYLTPEHWLQLRSYVQLMDQLFQPPDTIIGLPSPPQPEHPQSIDLPGGKGILVTYQRAFSPQLLAAAIRQAGRNLASRSLAGLPAALRPAATMLGSTAALCASTATLRSSLSLLPTNNAFLQGLGDLAGLVCDRLLPPDNADPNLAAARLTASMLEDINLSWSGFLMLPIVRGWLRLGICPLDTRALADLQLQLAGIPSATNSSVECGLPVAAENGPAAKELVTVASGQLRYRQVGSDATNHRQIDYVMGFCMQPTCTPELFRQDPRAVDQIAEAASALTTSSGESIATLPGYSAAQAEAVRAGLIEQLRTQPTAMFVSPELRRLVLLRDQDGWRWVTILDEARAEGDKY